MSIARNNELHKTCRGCIWAAECNSDERCWGYDTGNTYQMIRGEYEHDLKMRVEAYKEIIRELKKD